MTHHCSGPSVYTTQGCARELGIDGEQFGGEGEVAGGDRLEDIGFGVLGAECGAGGGQEERASGGCHGAILRVPARRCKTEYLNFV